jgi:hypothetical protein
MGTGKLLKTEQRNPRDRRERFQAVGTGALFFNGHDRLFSMVSNWWCRFEPSEKWERHSSPGSVAVPGPVKSALDFSGF